jgi:hypothetical protein
MEAGTILVDKSRHLDALLLAEWMMSSERFEYWFKCVRRARASLSAQFSVVPRPDPVESFAQLLGRASPAPSPSARCKR